MNYLLIFEFEANLDINTLSDIASFLVIKRYISHLEIKSLISLNSNAI